MNQLPNNAMELDMDEYGVRGGWRLISSPLKGDFGNAKIFTFPTILHPLCSPHDQPELSNASLMIGPEAGL